MKWDKGLGGGHALGVISPRRMNRPEPTPNNNGHSLEFIVHLEGV